jgi:hypothetical protein
MNISLLFHPSVIRGPCLSIQGSPVTNFEQQSLVPKIVAYKTLKKIFYNSYIYHFITLVFFLGDLAPDRQSQSLYDQLKKEVTDRGMEVKETLKKFQGKVFHAVNTTHGIMLRYR